VNSFAVVGEDGVNLKCCSFADGGQEGFGGRCRLVLLDINEHPACGPINGNKDIAALVLILHLGQVLHIYMHIARLIRLEGFVLAQAWACPVRSGTTARPAHAPDIGRTAQTRAPAAALGKDMVAHYIPCGYNFFQLIASALQRHQKVSLNSLMLSLSALTAMLMAAIVLP
jgi:hypothetical protein